MNEEFHLILIFRKAIQEAPLNLFEEFNEIKPLLLDNSPITKNRPLFYGIIENLLHFKNNGNIIYPIPFPQIKSDETAEMLNDFMKNHISDLNDVDLSNIQSIHSFLTKIGLHGIRVLLGIRRTTGSYGSILPPNSQSLYEAFNERHKGQPLTVGGRALSKHSVRDSSKFWGISSGTADHINNAAIRCLDHIIENNVWLNVFALPHDTKAFEIRCNPGYGARWEYKNDGKIFFRGFLEPAIEDGHLKKWRH